MKISKDKLEELMRELIEPRKDQLSRGNVEQQRRSFALGNSGMDHNDFTRATVARIDKEVARSIPDDDKPR